MNFAHLFVSDNSADARCLVGCLTVGPGCLVGCVLGPYMLGAPKPAHVGATARKRQLAAVPWTHASATALVAIATFALYFKPFLRWWKRGF